MQPWQKSGYLSLRVHACQNQNKNGGAAPKEEWNLVKTFELSEVIRREGDHGSLAYGKKAMIAHRSHEISCF